jgi:hypothetical protein
MGRTLVPIEAGLMVDLTPIEKVLQIKMKSRKIQMVPPSSLSKSLLYFLNSTSENSIIPPLQETTVDG